MAKLDLSSLSDEDLNHLSTGNLQGLSDEALNRLASSAASDPSQAQPDETSAAQRFGQGLKDPINAGAQLLTQALPKPVVEAGNQLNNWLADKTGLVGRLPTGGVDQQVREQELAYQQARGDRGGKFDPWRMAGNVINPVTLAAGAAAPEVAGLGWLGQAALGGVVGGTTGAALTPVTEGDPNNFWGSKAKQAALGAVTGAAVSPVANLLGRVISPKASTNPQLQLLKDEGIEPTLGQTLGGTWNNVEQKLTSVPIAGDAIAYSRNRAANQFENAAINRSQAPIGQRVAGTGFDAVNDAHLNVSAAYDRAKQALGGVTLDPQFHQDLGNLTQMSSGLTPALQKKFADLVQNNVMGKATVGPNGLVMLPDTFKKVDSELGQEAAKYISNKMSSAQDYGNAVKQLQQHLTENAYRANPQAAQMLGQADEAFANLARIEAASRAAGNASGHFSPAQLNNALKLADRSARGNQFARGQALMQDLGDAGQSVLGNRVPDSGTAGRVMMGLGTLGSLLHPATAPLGGAALVGASAYLPPVQSLLRGLVSARPAAAQEVAGALTRAAPSLAAPASLMISNTGK